MKWLTANKTNMVTSKRIHLLYQREGLWFDWISRVEINMFTYLIWLQTYTRDTHAVTLWLNGFFFSCCSPSLPTSAFDLFILLVFFLFCCCFCQMKWPLLCVGHALNWLRTGYPFVGVSGFFARLLYLPFSISLNHPICTLKITLSNFPILLAKVHRHMLPMRPHFKTHPRSFSKVQLLLGSTTSAAHTDLIVIRLTVIS